MSSLILGIEIGGTKLQLAVGNGQTDRFEEFVRLRIDRKSGAAGILGQIDSALSDLQQRYSLSAVSYGFGGPVDGSTGSVITSHQVEGWTGFPLADWTSERTGVPVVVANDCDAAALGEATLGAGQNSRTVFYVTVGTGIGGGLVIDGRLQGTDRPAVAEIGHLRPGPECNDAAQTLESIASGLGIERRAIRMAKEAGVGADGLIAASGGSVDDISCQAIAASAADGNELARSVLREATRTLGWGIAQVITIVAPDIVVVGGGVSLMPADLFFEPLRDAVRTYSFGPLRDSCGIVPAKLGEDVVVHGAIANALRKIG